MAKKRSRPPAPAKSTIADTSPGDLVDVLNGLGRSRYLVTGLGPSEGRWARFVAHDGTQGEAEYLAGFLRIELVKRGTERLPKLGQGEVKDPVAG